MCYSLIYVSFLLLSYYMFRHCVSPSSGSLYQTFIKTYSNKYFTINLHFCDVSSAGLGLYYYYCYYYYIHYYVYCNNINIYNIIITVSTTLYIYICIILTQTCTTDITKMYVYCKLLVFITACFSERLV
jgi:hypothetical protein